MTVASLVLAFAVGARATDGEPRVVSLEVFPSVLRLDGPDDASRLVIVATDDAGVMRDVTGAATLTFADPGVARVDETGRLRPLADGVTRFRASYGAVEVLADVVVAGAARVDVPLFRRDVIPVLTRAGCNAGGCHGSAAGKNGFKLSLFGYDPAADHRRLTRELRGRRVDLATPDESLILAKPTMRAPHKGGRRLDPAGALYRTIRDWVAAGAAWTAHEPELIGIELAPPTLVLEAGATDQRLVVRAIFDDGTDRDVTGLAILSSSNDTAARVDDEARVAADVPGEAFVMARYGAFAVASQVLVLPPRDGAAPAAAAAPWNYVDEAIHGKLARMRLTPGPVCTDEAFLRRVWLDVLGTLPPVAATRAFLADADPAKRAKVVDDLLARPRFADVIAAEWADVLKIDGRNLKGKAAHLYSDWLRQGFRAAKPVDEMVREILLARGSTFEVPPAGFYEVDRDPKVVAENFAQVFLGVRIQCAQCHNHPFERWTMDDYYGLAAFFARVGTKRGEDARETVVFDRSRGDVRDPRTGRAVAPKFLGGAQPELAEGDDPRAALADWVTDRRNPGLARNVANRLFARFMGRGLVEPVDDVRASNPASHPGLYETLGERLLAYDFDLRRLVRDITASRSYQLAVRSDPVPPASFAGAVVRRLTAEQVLDAIDTATEVPTRFSGAAPDATAIDVADGDANNYFLEAFGRPLRTSVCSCERRGEPTLGQALHLINGDTISRKIADGGGRLVRLLKEGRSDDEIIEELYLASLCRLPTAAERARLGLELAAGADRRTALEDVFWALLNSKEFQFTH